MPDALAILSPSDHALPVQIANAGDKASWRFIEFFTAAIRNPNTREAYARAVSQFLDWCSARGVNDLLAETHRRTDGDRLNPAT